jgi:hypothetical protein
VNGEIRAVHAAKIAPAAFFLIHHMGRMIALGVERRRERQNLGRAEFNAKAASLTSLYDYRDGTTCHFFLLTTDARYCPVKSGKRDVTYVTDGSDGARKGKNSQRNAK